MNFFIKTYGCQMNVNDSEKMRYILERKGLIAVDDEDSADIVIINSCAVRAKPQEKIFSYAGRLAKDKRIIVAGCVAQSEREIILKKNPHIDFILGTHQFYRIDEIVDALKDDRSRGMEVDFCREWQELMPGIEARQSTVSAYISIMEGCNNFCSYCIVPFTRGPEKHRPFENIVQEAEYLAARGYQEIILLGQNVNNWQDRQRGLRLPDLLDYLAKNIDVRWIRFITSYPGYYDRELIAVMAENRRIARHIHFPAQSGSSRVLKRMNRTYTRAQYLKIIADFRKKIPGMKFSSDFIVGFPGETERDFEQTLSLLEKVEYESIFSFIYSPRKHTKAYGMKEDIDLQTRKERLYTLQETQEKIQLKNNSMKIGQVIEVLVSAKNPKKPAELIGRTESYQVVNFSSTAKPGEFRRVLIENIGPYSLRGKDVN